MKIIYYSPHPHLNLMSPSGYGTHMREMITAFRNLGCQVQPVIMGGEEDLPQEMLERDPSTPKKWVKNVLPDTVWRSLKDLHLLWFDASVAAKRLEQAIEEFNPDCIYERCYYLQTSGLKMAKKYGLTHVMEINSPYVDQTNFLGKSKSYLERYARHIERKQVAETDLPLAVVGPLQDFFCERYGIDPNKFLITHDAFSKENIQLHSDNQQKIINRYQLRGKKVIGFVGSIFEWHGLDKLIKAIDEIDRPDLKLFIVGFGEYTVHLVELAKSLNREGDIIFTGRVPNKEIFDYISCMDICTAPNAAWYQSPVKIFEYGALGKPILGPNTPAVREIMVPDEDGMLIEPTIQSVKEGINYLLENPHEGKKMGRHFQQKVLNEYTWNNNAEKVLEVIRRLEAHSEEF